MNKHGLHLAIVNKELILDLTSFHRENQHGIVFKHEGIGFEVPVISVFSDVVNVCLLVIVLEVFYLEDGF